MNFLFKRKWALLSSLALLTALVAGSALVYETHQPAAAVVAQYKTPEEADPYVRFDMEGYDKIAGNYWMKAEDKDLSQLFQLSLQKALNLSALPDLVSQDRTGAAHMLGVAFGQATSTEAKRQLAVNVLIVATYNLAPQGRNGVLSQAQETALRQEVSNINPGKDLYKDLGVSSGASKEEVEVAYKEKETTLKNATSTEAKQELAQAQYAHEVLTNDSNKALYDQAKIEPTLFGHVLGKTLYLNLTKVSPTSLQEFALGVDQASTTPGLDSMIIDLRGNVGGALDFVQHFMGLFIGKDQYAFDLFHQGEYQVQRTQQPHFPELDRFKEIAILTDGMTQSTAEVTTAAFKKFKLAHIVGTKTRGWGTVENTFPLTTEIDPAQKYSLLLVHSLTLREDNQPVEGRGVDPDVDTSNPDWKNQLSHFFSSGSLISALKKQATAAPIQ